IIVNWNSTAYTRQCIRSIYNYTHNIGFEVIVVDNASSSNNVDGLADDFPNIVLIKSSENLGFARANNLGARNANGDFILFLNPDTELIEPALELLVEQIKSCPIAGALGCRLLNADRTVQTSCVQAFPTILNQMLDADALRSCCP